MSAASGAAAAAANANPFQYHTRILQVINSLTVAQIKQLIKNLNNKINAGIRLAGNKPVLLERLQELELSLYTARDTQRYNNFRIMLGEEAHRLHPGELPEWARGTMSEYKAPVRPAGYPAPPAGNSNAAAGPSRLGGIPAAPTYSFPGASSISNGSSMPRPKFTASPFYAIHEWISGPITMPEAHGNERKIARVQFSLSRAQSELMTTQPTRYGCRLFSTTAHQWDTSTRTQSLCYVDFPTGADININGVRYTPSLKGNKKNPGRVPPADLNHSKAMFVQEGRMNQITLAYYADRSMYATHVGKHIMGVALCRLTTPAELVEKLTAERSRDKDTVIAGMRARKDDDEIEAGAQAFRLKDPLSFMNIAVPIRSQACPHVQVFDALIFLTMNEQTPTWQCPVCSQDLKWEHLFVDGFAKDIMKRVPSSCEKVLVETDGTWRTEDGKVTSKGVVEAPAPAPAAPPVASSSSNTSAPASSPAPAAAPAAAKQEIVVLDDSPSPPRRPAAARRAPAAASSGGLAAADAIDLTFSSDEDDDDDAPLVAPPRPAAVAPRAPTFSSPPLSDSGGLPRPPVSPTPVTPPRMRMPGSNGNGGAAAQTSSSAASADLAGASGSRMGPIRTFSRTASSARLEAAIAAAEAEAALDYDEPEAAAARSSARRPRDEDDEGEGSGAEKRAKNDAGGSSSSAAAAAAAPRIDENVLLPEWRQRQLASVEEEDEEDDEEEDDEESMDPMDRSSEEWSDYPFGRRRVWSGVPGVRARKLRKNEYGEFVRERSYDSELDDEFDEEEEEEEE